MSAAPPSRPVRPWTVWTPLGSSLAVVVLLATTGSFGAGFGVMTNCTNTFSCTTTACRPCATADTWLTLGWVAQAALLLVGVTLTVLGARRIRERAVRLAACLLGPLSSALFVLTTWVAIRSF